jgi:hypothetical protein
MHRTLIAAERQPDGERHVARIFAQSDLMEIDGTTATDKARRHPVPAGAEERR